MRKYRRRPWHDIALEAQKYRDASLAKVEPPLPNIPAGIPRKILETMRLNLTSQEVEISELSPEKLVERLRNGRYTAVAVTSAFLRRAVLAQKLVRLLICRMTEKRRLKTLTSI